MIRNSLGDFSWSLFSICYLICLHKKRFYFAFSLLSQKFSVFSVTGHSEKVHVWTSGAIWMSNLLKKTAETVFPILSLLTHNLIFFLIFSSSRTLSTCLPDKFLIWICYGCIVGYHPSYTVLGFVLFVCLFSFLFQWKLKLFDWKRAKWNLL